jgi:TRAP-type C4-dicarboxylate transport system substrate-binding protein
MSRGAFTSLGCALVVLSWAGAGRAEPILLRMATAAPEGTAWAREGHAFERDIAELTHDRVHMKWYLGGIAGDEMRMLERVKKEQLDGVASGGMLCQRLAPTLRVMRVVGLFQSRDESAYVAGRLKGTLDAEFLRAGFVNLGEFGVGPDVIFSRAPVASMADLRKARLWVWDLDDVFRQSLTAMGISIVPRPLESAARDYDSGMTDGFLGVPSAALAFQWSTEVRYYTDLRPSFLRGCLLISSRAFDQLPVDGQVAVKQAAARTIVRLEEIGRAQDAALLDKLFVKQGLVRVPVSDSFRSEFVMLAQQARERLSKSVVSEALLQRVLALLADYRAAQSSGDGER